MLLDELQRLRDSEGLRRLLVNYAEQNVTQPEAWLDRLMQIDGADEHDLVRWHGELIAFGWIEQNTGHTPACRPGVAASCYRITAVGRRALRDSETSADGDSGHVQGGTEGAQSPGKVRRTGRRKKVAAETAAVNEVSGASAS